MRTGWMTQTGGQEPLRTSNPRCRACLELNPLGTKARMDFRITRDGNFCVLPIFILLTGMSTEVILLPNVYLMDVEWMI